VLERRTMAVMFTDVAGFSARMERDETEAMGILERQRSTLEALLPPHGGSLVKEMGDGTLSIFPNASSSVRCARRMQEKLAGADFSIRVGIHWGEVLVDRSDIFGDTVNVASRLEELSAPGGICISGELLRGYGSSRVPAVEKLGLRKLKGLGRLVDVYAIRGTGAKPLPSPRESVVDSIVLPGETSGILSVVVTTLENLGVPEDDFYSYSITSDLVSDLTRAGRIRVVPLTETLKLQDAGMQPAEIAARLGVRFLAKGSFWKQKGSLELSIELLDTTSDRLVWADSWLDDWIELPSLKGKLADGILKAIGFEPARFSGMTGSETTATGAYELYLKARHTYRRRRSTSDALEAERILGEALEQDPGLVPGMLLLGSICRDSCRFEQAMELQRDALEAALAGGDTKWEIRARNEAGITLLRQCDFKGAREAFLQVLKLSKHDGDRDGEAKALNNLGLVEWNSGDYRVALRRFESSLEAAQDISSSYQQASALHNTGLVNWSLGDYQAALENYRKALDLLIAMGDLADQADVLRNMGNVHLRMGSFDKAMESARRALQISREMGDRKGECRSLNNMGNVRIHLGAVVEARTYYEAALRIIEEFSDGFLEGVIRTNLGMVQMTSGDPEGALPHFTRALEAARLVGDTEGEATVLAQLGEVCLKTGNPLEAIGKLHQAISLMESTGSTFRVPETKCFLALAVLETDRSPGAAAKALELVRQAEGDTPTEAADRAAKLWLLSKAYASLAAASVDGDQDLQRRRAGLVNEAHEALMASAEKITDPRTRVAFLNQVESHREIIEAWNSLT
jgi:tetratricopeptide (TPR) repeat protein/class 3 adenylate cyclase